MNDPANDASPCGAADDPAIDPDILRAAAQLDTRTQDQRNHDALSAMLTYLVSSGQLGNTHNGLPAQLIIFLSKADLDNGTGMAHTATGVDIPVEGQEVLVAHDLRSRERREGPRAMQGGARERSDRETSEERA